MNNPYEVKPMISFSSEYNDFKIKEKELSQHLEVSLKIAGNLKELTNQTDVKDFFFTRFRKQIVKKNLIDKILDKVAKYIKETELIIRSENNNLFRFAYLV